MKTLWFDGQSAAAHGLMISGTGAYDAAERDVEMVSIPGRNGDLIIDKGRYKNIPVSYPASICTDFETNAAKARAWLGSRVGYCRLEDDYDPEHFRLGRFKGPLRFTPGFLNRTAECTLTFDCKPQRFLKSGEVPIPLATSGANVVVNPTGFPAQPLFCIQCAEGFTLDLIRGGETSCWINVTAEDGYDHVYIDFDGLYAYSIAADGNQVPRTMSVGGEYDGLFIDPELMWLEVICETEGAVQSVEMTPRWWTL